jgi:hypothetical protein
MSTIDLFLEELKSAYKQEFELKATLENKANYLLVASGVTMSLLFSFGVELIGKLNHDYEFLPFVIGFLMFSVIANGMSILLSILGFALTPYRFSLPYNVFFKKDQTTNKFKFNNKVIEEFRDGKGETDNESITIFKETIIENYLRCNLQNGRQNNWKAIIIKTAQWLFFAGAISIPFIIGFALPFLWSTAN